MTASGDAASFVSAAASFAQLVRQIPADRGGRAGNERMESAGARTPSKCPVATTTKRLRAELAAELGWYPANLDAESIAHHRADAATNDRT